MSYGASGGAKSVFFIDSEHGYLYGDGLFETSDGGLHWHAIPIPGPIFALTATSSQLDVIAQTCPASTPLCPYSALYVGALNGTGYREVTAIGMTASAQLARDGARTVVVYSPAASTTPSTVPVGIGTSTDGVNWTVSKTPCQAEGADAAGFGDTGLALVCGAGPSAGVEGKSVYVSYDNGANWTQRGVTATPGSESAPGSLSIDGYIGLLAAADAQTWVLAEDRGTLLITHDGGITWHTSDTSRVRENQGTDEWGQLYYIDSTHVIAVPNNYYSDAVLQSNDAGNTWASSLFTAKP